MAVQWIEADWPAPANVRAITTLRGGGVSEDAYSSLNLATHVGDAPDAVAINRARLRASLSLDAEPLWLDQVHGTDVVTVNAQTDGSWIPTADAAVCRGRGRPCAILTADCLPVVFCDLAGSRVGAAHAGWRGLAGGVLGATVEALGVPPDDLLAWLGPAIEQNAFEVGDEVREQFIARHAEAADAFIANPQTRWQADLYALARIELASLGVRRVYGGGHRCFDDRARFFSYRREKQTGRMATLIWMAWPGGPT